MSELPEDRGEWQDLPEPIKIRWTGKLRSRVQERQWDYAATKEDGEWVADDDADPKPAGSYLALTRQKTNIVLERVEEAQALYWTIGYYADNGASRHGITWMNGPMVDAAWRVRDEIVSRLDDMDGIEVVSTDRYLEVEVE